MSEPKLPAILRKRVITPTRVIPAGAPLPPAAQPVAPAPVPTPRPSTAGGAGGAGWTPPPPPAQGWWTPQPPAPRGGVHPVPAAPAPTIEVHVTLHPAVPPELTRWQRLWRAVPYRVSPLVAGTALLAAIYPIPGVGYGVARIWGSLVEHIGTDIHYIPANLAGAAALAVVAARIHRPARVRVTSDGATVHQLTWLDSLGLAVTVIGGTWGALMPDIVAAITGVRA